MSPPGCAVEPSGGPGPITHCTRESVQQGETFGRGRPSSPGVTFGASGVALLGPKGPGLLGVRGRPDTPKPCITSPACSPGDLVHRRGGVPEGDGANERYPGDRGDNAWRTRTRRERGAES